jgi:hypothetical protein
LSTNSGYSDTQDIEWSRGELYFSNISFVAVFINSCNGELHKLYSSPDIIRQIKSRRKRWAGHVARMGDGRNVYRVLVGKPKGKYHLEDQGVYGRMGSKLTLERLVGGVEWIHLAQDRDCWRAVVNAVTNIRVLAPQS